MVTKQSPSMDEHSVEVVAGTAVLQGHLEIPDGAESIVLFAHGSGSSRFSPRNRFVARGLQEGGFATLLLDLLTSEEEKIDVGTRKYRFDIELLTTRVVGATDWLLSQAKIRNLRVGYFGSSTGAAAALFAAARRPEVVGAVVSRGGRPDLAISALPDVKAPTLLIVGGNDTPVIEFNEQALEHLRTEKRIEIVQGASHLFEEPGTLEKVVHLARQWFQKHLTLSEAYRKAV